MLLICLLMILFQNLPLEILQYIFNKLDFKKQMDHVVQMLKDAPKAPGHDRIYIAGEKEYDNAKYNEEHGVPVIAPVIEDLKKDGEKMGLPFDIKPVSSETK